MTTPPSCPVAPGNDAAAPEGMGLFTQRYLSCPQNRMRFRANFELSTKYLLKNRNTIYRISSILNTYIPRPNYCLFF
ncbi:hypothetical protein CLOSTMETH_01515 [[Clostridium] methylpentosum DSM 5476]|uniref:Uncharacterized protein n=1 Tax=[Clostridium] methylpentosum DSM 5476 TaxID=537013 RepID=C0ECE5_9FIRM|nr:hypothetical protein CLOSTMETH_01515 [[Clostridium] methylpentosum DSM 5476]